MKFTGGALTVKRLPRWVRALPPQYTAQLREANDTMLTKFARILTQNVLLLREADANKIAITPLEWATLKRHYEGQLDTLRAEMGLQDGRRDGRVLALPSGRRWPGSRSREYFDQLIDGKTRLRPLPSALATLLRDRLPYAVHDAGVNRAVELATELKAKADSPAPQESDAARARRAAGAGPAAGARRLAPRTAPGTPAPS